MNLVTKKCPNCGASLSFNEDDTKIKCEYCKQQIMIEREKKSPTDLFNTDDFILEVAEMQKVHSKMATGVIVFIIICFISIMVFGIIMTYEGISDQEKFRSKFQTSNNTSLENSDTWEENSNQLEITGKKAVEEILQIDDKTLEQVKSSGLNVLNEFTTDINGNNTQKWNYVGFYFLKPKNRHRNSVYIVYKKKYTVNKKAKEYYAAVSYSGFEIDSDGNVTFSDFGFPYAPMDVINWDTVYGYESNKDLYEKVIKENTENYDISATDGLYLEK